MPAVPRRAYFFFFLDDGFLAECFGCFFFAARRFGRRSGKFNFFLRPAAWTSSSHASAASISWS